MIVRIGKKPIRASFYKRLDNVSIKWYFYEMGKEATFYGNYY